MTFTPLPTEGFKAISSKHKWLEVHGQKKWAYYHDPANVERQRQFFDAFLKNDRQSKVWSWPTVRLQVRETATAGDFRDDHRFPLPETQYKKLYLHGRQGTLREQPSHEAGLVAYDSESDTDRAQFEYKFDTNVDLIGHMKLRLWVEARDAADADLFVTVQKLDRNGQIVGFTFLNEREDGPVALGWLRASHRALDRRHSKPYQPVHLHTAESIEPLVPGVPVPVEIEILPSATSFDRGETLRVTVQGKSMYSGAWLNYARANRSQHVIHTGGPADSHLLIPVVRPERASRNRS